MFVKPNPLMQCPNCGAAGTQGYTGHKYKHGLYTLYFCSACICSLGKEVSTNGNA